MQGTKTKWSALIYNLRNTHLKIYPCPYKQLYYPEQSSSDRSGHWNAA